MTPLIRSFFVVLILSSGLVVYGQQPAPGTNWVLYNIKFEGMDSKIPYDEAVKASGLKIGQSIDMPAMQESMNTLANAGLFRRVGMSYTYKDGKLDINFKILEAEPLVQFRCRFDNFIGITDEHINDAIKKVLPNYEGTVNKFEADSGKIEAVLNELMSSRNQTGKVIQELSTDARGNNSTLIFKIDNPSLKICSIQFPGASPKIVPAFIEVTHWLIDTPYSKYDLNQAIKSGLIPIIKEHGYLRVKVDEHSVIPSSDEKCKSGISIDIPVQQGSLYGFEKVIWANNKVLSDNELNDVWTMKPGDIPSPLNVSKAVGGFIRAYGAKGYMGMKFKQDMEIDDSPLRFSYKISINEGSQYRMGKFISKVLSDAELNKLTDKCKLKQSDLFTGEYIQEFMQGKLNYEKFIYGFDTDHESRIVNIEIKKKD